jgi:integrase/recombinase XerD
MGHLRDRMEQDLILTGLAPTTRRNYLLYCRKFAAYYRRNPEELGEPEIRAFLLHTIQVEQVSYATYRQLLAAIKFLYQVTLRREWEVSRLPFPKHRPPRLPQVLREDQLLALFAALQSPKYRALFMTCYAAGLRISEACRLRIEDIDSRRMVIRVRQGKGPRNVTPSCHRACSLCCDGIGSSCDLPSGCSRAWERRAGLPSGARAGRFGVVVHTRPVQNSDTVPCD